MKATITKQPNKGTVAAGKQRSYNEVVEFLDAHWQTNANDKSLSCITQLNKAFDGVAQKLSTILVSGVNGKSLTMQFTAQLLKEEGLNVGIYYAPHFLIYNERITVNDELISNKTFTDLANDVINTAESLGLTPNSSDILTMMAILHFSAHQIDVALLEVGNGSDAARVCTPKISAITRITTTDMSQNSELLQKKIEDVLSTVHKDAHVISADQSKITLKTMAEIVHKKGATWAMPIRKLANLAYPYEQLHGRCAALAERIAYIYINTFAAKDAVVISGTLLTKQKGQRGRPTIEAKRLSELNPRKTVEQFWKETLNALPARFQILDKEKPTVLLDNANNLDAFENLLLGIRLLHYKRPLKGLTLVLGCNNPELDVNELLKMLRYFFKKTSGQVVICPVNTVPGHVGGASWDVEKVANDIKNMKIKVKAATSFKDGFEYAEKSVDERHGLVVIAGSPSLVTEYWNYKGIKKI